VLLASKMYIVFNITCGGGWCKFEISAVNIGIWFGSSGDDMGIEH
jgi:hypothetical protein